MIPSFVINLKDRIHRWKKFKELKSLIYEYRDKKENEISKLNTKHIHLKNEIELSQQSYEKLIDEATNEISNFVKKTNLGNLS